MSYYDIFLRQHKKNIDMLSILEHCLKGSGFTVFQAKSKSRKRELVCIRQSFFLVCMKISEDPKYIKKTSVEIGRFVNRHHATVLYSKNNANFKEIKAIVNRVLILIKD